MFAQQIPLGRQQGPTPFSYAHHRRFKASAPSLEIHQCPLVGVPILRLAAQVKQWEQGDGGELLQAISRGEARVGEGQWM